MLLGRKRHSSGSFGPDGRRVKPPPPMTCAAQGPHSSNKLFQPGAKILVQRAPVMCGLSIPAGLQKKFQRPMTKRRAYGKHAEQALQASSLGQRKRFGMTKLLARAGKGLTYKVPKRKGDDTASCSDSEDEEQEEERPFEPLQVWTSPHQGGECKGLPPRIVTEMQADEYGVEHEVTLVKPAPVEAYNKQNVLVPPVLAKWLRPHQREGVQFMYECVQGMRGFSGQGCILADDMGLGKTLQSVALIYTLLKTGITANGAATAKRVIVVCPCSLVKNWEQEFVKWLGPGQVRTLALAESDRKSVEKNLDLFVGTKMFTVLIVSYETLRTHILRLTKHKDCCDLLVCDEAHRLKNNENQTSRALASLPVKRRVLLTGTPMQNDLQEFFAMVDFTNPGVLGSQEEFRKKVLSPILRGREPDATESQKKKMQQIQNDMSTTVNEFILRRVNTLNAQHLPPKLVQVVCCNLTEMQSNIYQHLVTNKDMAHVLDGKQANCLGYIQMLMKLCNHPKLIVEEDSKAKVGGRRAAKKAVKYTEDEPSSKKIAGADGISKFLPYVDGSMNAPVNPEWSGKMFVLWRLMKEMRKPGNGNDKIVIISNYTQTLDLIGKMCRENSWGFCRLDGSVALKKRQKMVEKFNDPSSTLIAFLLSSKAGGCGLNLIGGNRLVLFDPDWNPAVDKQAAARCWRDGQKKRCFTYRFLATGTVEEKIFQRQLSKEGLQSVVDDKEQVNTLSTKDLRNLFKFRAGTPSDTHDKLQCERCKIIADNAEMEAAKVLPQKLAACKELLNRMFEIEGTDMFAQPLDPTVHEVSKEEYEKIVKQPMDLGTIRKKLELEPGAPSAYTSVSGFSKDVNRIFANVMKVWEPGQAIADVSRQLQTWWVSEWTQLVPKLMAMKSESTCEEHPDHEEEKKEDDAVILSPTLNERGEDFQEQIGMPDEQNMRSWSHHYSTDTVDDPIFRAAMKGCVSVSFVFGLEVTWSLIQQRAQEEEEKQAMEELEGLKELQALEDQRKESDDDDSGDDGSSSESDRDGNASNEDDVKDFIVEDEENSAEDEEKDFVVEDVENPAEDSDSSEEDEEVEESDSSEEDEEMEAPVAETKEKKDAGLALTDSSSSSSDDEEMEAPAAETKKKEVDLSLTESSSSEDEDDKTPAKKEKPIELDSSTESEPSPATDEKVEDSDTDSEPSPANGEPMEEDSSDDEDVKPPPKKKRVQNQALSSSDEEVEPPPKKKRVQVQAFSSSEESSSDEEDVKPPPKKKPAEAEPSQESTGSSVAVPSNKWACPTCTLHNDKPKRKCVACGAKKPPQKRK